MSQTPEDMIKYLKERLINADLEYREMMALLAEKNEMLERADKQLRSMKDELGKACADAVFWMKSHEALLDKKIKSEEVTVKTQALKES